MPTTTPTQWLHFCFQAICSRHISRCASGCSLGPAGCEVTPALIASITALAADCAAKANASGLPLCTWTVICYRELSLFAFKFRAVSGRCFQLRWNVQSSCMGPCKSENWLLSIRAMFLNTPRHACHSLPLPSQEQQDRTSCVVALLRVEIWHL